MHKINNKFKPIQLAKKWVKNCCFQLLISIFITSCAFAPWQKSDVGGHSPEARLANARKSVSSEPEKIIARKDLIVTTELLTTKLLIEAKQAIGQERYEEAASIYDRVLYFVPDEPHAIDGKVQIERDLALTRKLYKAKELFENKNLESAKQLVREVLMENPQQSTAVNLMESINDQLGAIKPESPRLKSPSDRPVSLELRDANIKVVFEALSRATGINFILDKDIKPDSKASIYIKNAQIEDAIDRVLSSNGLRKKTLSDNTVLIYPNTQQKLKEYQEVMVRSFYFSNTSAKQVSELLKTMLKTKDIYVDDRLNMLIMRDTPEVIKIAEKLVAANDLADPEVMLDIEVLEVSRGRFQELGVVYPNQLAVLSTDTPLTLEALKNITSKTIGVSPNPAVNFKKTIGDVNLLSNPRIRVKNNEKAKILVGDKVPIITTTSTADVGISENVTYIDVGLKLDVEPHITLDNFVNIKVGLEVSSLGEETTTRNGASVFTIGTRNANTVLRLKDGETQVLAGLILDDERKNASKLPGIGDIPLLGRLFSNQVEKRSKTEIVLAITPKIISNISLPRSEIIEYWSGTESSINDTPQVNLSSTNDPASLREEIRDAVRLRREANQQIQKQNQK